MESNALFHLAFPVTNLKIAKQFYGDLLGCAQGRSTELWVDFNFYGHQIVAHLVTIPVTVDMTNKVDGDDVPIPHFGAILPMEVWQALADKLSVAGVAFIIKPHLRFQGQVGEQANMFFRDPFGNALEFKAFQDTKQIFEA